MKLYRVVAIYDALVVGNDEDDAKEAVANAIDKLAGGPEFKLLEIRDRVVLSHVDKESPVLVGNAVSDQDFASIKGKKAQALFEQLYTKQR